MKESSKQLLLEASEIDNFLPETKLTSRAELQVYLERIVWSRAYQKHQEQHFAEEGKKARAIAQSIAADLVSGVQEWKKWRDLSLWGKFKFTPQWLKRLFRKYPFLHDRKTVDYGKDDQKTLVHCLTQGRESFKKKSFETVTIQELSISLVPGDGDEPKLLPEVAKLDFLLHVAGMQDAAILNMQNVLGGNSDREVKAQTAWSLISFILDRPSHRLYTREYLFELINYIEASDWLANQLATRRIVMYFEAFWGLGLPKLASELLDAASKYDPIPELLWLHCIQNKSEEKRIELINDIFRFHHLETISLCNSGGLSPFDRIRNPPLNYNQESNSLPLVSIIMPMKNAEVTLPTAIHSVVTQTYENFELIIVDDNSNDSSVQLAHEFAKKDRRIRVHRLTHGSGAYAARNFGLETSKGKYVTCHDADDWSHPKKIEIQVKDLEDNPQYIANMTQYVRVDEALTPLRRGKRGYFTQVNASSLLFRRSLVHYFLGYWDYVKFGADSEFIERMKSEFGHACIHNLESGPLSIVRTSNINLSSSNVHGYFGYLTGCRHVYSQLFRYYHRTSTSLRLNDPFSQRLFPVPRLMCHNLSSNPEMSFDLVIMADFREHSPSISQLIDWIYQIDVSTTRIAFSNAYINNYSGSTSLSSNTKWSVDILALILNKNIPVLVYGEEAFSKKLLIHGCDCIGETQVYMPKITVDTCVLLLKQNHNAAADSDQTIKSIHQLFSPKEIITSTNSDVFDLLNEK